MKPVNISSASLNVSQKSEASSNNNVLNVISKLSTNAGINLSSSTQKKSEKAIENSEKAMSSLTKALLGAKQNTPNSSQSAVVKALSENAKPKFGVTNPTKSLFASKIAALKNTDEVNDSKRVDKNNSSSKNVTASKSPQPKSAEEKTTEAVSKVVKTAISEQQKISAVVKSKF